MIRVAICDDDRTILHGLETLLRADPDLELVAVVETGEDALAVTTPVDVWLMDVRLPGMSGIQVATELKASGNSAKALIMTSFDVGEVLNALEVGIGGFVHKGAFLLNVTAAVKAVHAGYQVGNDVVTAALARHLDRLAIVDPARANRVAKDDTDRQLLELVLRSRSIAEMAETTHISVSATHKRLGKMFRRAGVQNQRGLSAWLYEVGER
ncbi:response regulator transcription factor [Tessaracoccus caeni]|uniref:response regulator transcription factor n=1 Tax=Tessaracoccus caeni TaxID=3031239 RepID=UPI0023DB9A1A|nr:response regulator transcription factor [Tessaracoccus caeni]MDF1488921.1 response regulator transcription factor [Tessaracoccus caeni]